MRNTVTSTGGDVHSSDYPKNGSVIAASTTFTKENGGGVYLVATDAIVITLPAVGADSAPYGMTLTFVNSGADGNNLITISPNASDAIYGSIANAAADSVSSGVDDKDLVNTKATSNKGDRITLMSDGDTGWFIIDGVGIWASEA